jgi:hypothetical protein
MSDAFIFGNACHELQVPCFRTKCYSPNAVAHSVMQRKAVRRWLFDSWNVKLRLWVFKVETLIEGLVASAKIYQGHDLRALNDCTDGQICAQCP